AVRISERVAEVAACRSGVAESRQVCSVNNNVGQCVNRSRCPFGLREAEEKWTQKEKNKRRQVTYLM
ncbi:MAG: hypothetical protein O7D30_08320, partial [Rickettsia endosymbiont of Ixodes persulcatus]|nr:hypothetical protein [Rickettsia endosymbiont of Ixodes persulcatus]